MNLQETREFEEDLAHDKSMTRCLKLFYHAYWDSGAPELEFKPEWTFDHPEAGGYLIPWDKALAESLTLGVISKAHTGQPSGFEGLTQMLLLGTDFGTVVIVTDRAAPLHQRAFRFILPLTLLKCSLWKEAKTPEERLKLLLRNLEHFNMVAYREMIQNRPRR